MNLKAKNYLGENYKKNIGKIFKNQTKSIFNLKKELKILKEDIDLIDNNNDLVFELKANDFIRSFIKEGYEETSYEEYPFLEYNSIYKINSNQTEFINPTSFNSEININDKILEAKFDSENIFFINKQETKVEYQTKFVDFELLDFKIYEDDIYMVILKQEEFYLIKTSLYLDFFNPNKTYFRDIEKEYKIKLEKDYGDIVYIKNNKIGFSNFFLKGKNKHNLITLGKNYYFEYNDKYFANVKEGNKSLERLLKKEPIQIETSFLYDLISILGLNDFNYKNRKISYREIEAFKKIMKFKFDHTRNGLLNYYNFNIDKDYKIFNKEKNFIVFGNFIYKNYKKGEYQIEITNEKETNDRTEELSLNVILYKDNNIVKQMRYHTHNKEMFFCNLRFKFRKINYKKNQKMFLNISAKDNYPAKIKNKKIEIPKVIKDNKKDFAYKANNKISYEALNYYNKKTNVYLEEGLLKIKNIETKQGFLFNCFEIPFIKNNTIINSDYKLFFKKKKNFVISEKETENRYVYKITGNGKLVFTPSKFKHIDLFKKEKITNFFKKNAGEFKFLNVITKPQKIFNLNSKLELINEKQINLSNKEIKQEFNKVFSVNSKKDTANITIEVKEVKIGDEKKKIIKSYDSEKKLISEEIYILNNDNLIINYENKKEYKKNILNIKDGNYILNFKNRFGDKIINRYNKEIFLSDKKTNNSLGIIRLPSLKECVIDKMNKYKKLKIINPETPNYKIKKKKNMLLTEKFKKEPLFYKFLLLEDTEYVIQDETGAIVDNILKEKENGDIVVYFAPERGKDYYVSTKNYNNVRIRDIIPSYLNLNNQIREPFLQNKEELIIKKPDLYFMAEEVTSNKKEIKKIYQKKFGYNYLIENNELKINEDGNFYLQKPNNENLIYISSKNLLKINEEIDYTYIEVDEIDDFYNENFKKISIPIKERKK